MAKTSKTTRKRTAPDAPGLRINGTPATARQAEWFAISLAQHHPNPAVYWHKLCELGCQQRGQEMFLKPRDLQTALGKAMYEAYVNDLAHHGLAPGDAVSGWEGAAFFDEEASFPLKKLG